ncbi:MAG: type I DNA topoisomerase, partial [Candidatus Saccharibacteria bacterium]|nr:type I DNA topoisomerase [Candidatus Saccharibacteria bacterium]
MAKNLVIVESPAKANTIEKYLGSDFKVLASVGHIRKDTKVDKTTFDVTYEIDPDHKKIISELSKAAKEATKVWLATDEDREGESISWHLCEVLKLPKDTARITFHEITKPALESAIANPRTVDMDMVSSQQARQTLDMLVGYDLSDIVRRKVPGAISAGRVQSPALRLIVERERQIEKFESKFSFKVSGEFADKGASLLASYDGESPENEAEAKKLLESLSESEFKVEGIEETEGTKANPVPLTTAALQIEANAKLGFSARTTMSAAQGLYQAGLITYHRTDSLNLSTQAVSSIAGYIKNNFGEKYLKTRSFKTKSAGAQEAHEAIRPTNISVTDAGKNNYEKRLYQLIWARTVATQMANAKIAKTTIKISHDFTAKGEVVIFDGFLRVYGNTKDTELPKVSKGDRLDLVSLRAKQNFAKPPARYTEGSLVKKLEELGIGRPSTYATIMSAIQARGYVVKGESEGEERDVVELSIEKGQGNVSRAVVKEKYGANKGKLIPTPIGELVVGFLTDNFNNIVDYKFTANIEKDLDLIAEAKLERVKMLRDFYKPFRDTV